jgi:hypothetical protein
MIVLLGVSYLLFNKTLKLPQSLVAVVFMTGSFCCRWFGDSVVLTLIKAKLPKFSGEFNGTFYKNIKTH